MTREVDRNGLPNTLAEGALPPKPRIVTSKALPLNKSQWNTKELPWRLTSDLTAAACASGLVSPLITIIDRAIIENASGRVALRTSILNSVGTLFTRPHHFLKSRPFLLISALYFGTYLTANSIDTISSTVQCQSPSSTTAGPAKFLATTGVNISLCLYKDSQYTKMFGPKPSGLVSPTRPVPRASFALFALRDSMTVFASFNLPPLIAPILPLTQNIEKQISRASAAQFLAPAGIQLFSTPLHLLGLDLYNRPRVSWRARVGRVGRDYLGSSLARMGRVIPAFGVGGVVNGGVRKSMMDIRL
ncbi:MAG: hypothetical protein Q9195_009470 [Heterodermia aff. obscurata]